MWQAFKIAVLFMMSMIALTACGTTSAPNDNAVATAINLPTRIATVAVITNNGTDGLSQTYVMENSLISSRLTVNYPTDWVAQQSGSQLLLASIDPDDITPESDVTVINILPVEGDMLNNFFDLTPDGILSQAMLDATGQVVDVDIIILDDEREVAFATPTLDDNPSLVYALQFDDEVFIVLTAIRSQGFSDEDRLLIEQLVSQLDYSDRETPQQED